MSFDHDLATTLRELAAVQRWVDHCTRDARSPLGAMQGPQGDAEPSRAPVDAADDRDAEWGPARALQRLLWTLSPTAQHVLHALAAGCPPGTAPDACARHVAREAVRDGGSDALCDAWRRLDAAVAREIAARGQMDAARALAAVGRRRRYAVPLEAVEGITKATQALDATIAARRSADDAWLACGVAMLAAAVGEWRTARQCGRMAA